MKMQALRSAAHAAGYAMATEETADAPAIAVHKEPSRALTVRRAPRRVRLHMLTAHMLMRRLSMRSWMVPHWSGRATA